VSGMSTPDLLSEVEDFLLSSGMGPSYFGKVAGGGSGVVERLRAKRPILNSTEEAIRQFIRENKRGAA
jgi:hypothetical protein